eukprot:GHVN01060317.1.p1 GENE.GHVN01060317.1~~GHVN01060317.1.p1  ORF type:complete len:1043 (+),score=204.14 GHVN01060317.1:1763-4891(+)
MKQLKKKPTIHTTTDEGLTQPPTHGEEESEDVPLGDESPAKNNTHDHSSTSKKKGGAKATSSKKSGKSTHTDKVGLEGMEEEKQQNGNEGKLHKSAVSRIIHSIRKKKKPDSSSEMRKDGPSVDFIQSDLAVGDEGVDEASTQDPSICEAAAVANEVKPLSEITLSNERSPTLDGDLAAAGHHKKRFFLQEKVKQWSAGLKRSSVSLSGSSFSKAELMAMLPQITPMLNEETLHRFISTNAELSNFLCLKYVTSRGTPELEWPVFHESPKNFVRRTLDKIYDRSGSATTQSLKVVRRHPTDGKLTDLTPLLLWRGRFEHLYLQYWMKEAFNTQTATAEFYGFRNTDWCLKFSICSVFGTFTVSEGSAAQPWLWRWLCIYTHMITCAKCNGCDPSLTKHYWEALSAVEQEEEEKKRELIAKRQANPSNAVERAERDKAADPASKKKGVVDKIDKAHKIDPTDKIEEVNVDDKADELYEKEQIEKSNEDELENAEKTESGPVKAEGDFSEPEKPEAEGESATTETFESGTQKNERELGRGVSNQTNSSEGETENKPASLSTQDGGQTADRSIPDREVDPQSLISDTPTSENKKAKDIGASKPKNKKAKETETPPPKNKNAKDTEPKNDSISQKELRASRADITYDCSCGGLLPRVKGDTLNMVVENIWKTDILLLSVHISRPNLVSCDTRLLFSSTRDGFNLKLLKNRLTSGPIIIVIHEKDVAGARNKGNAFGVYLNGACPFGCNSKSHSYHHGMSFGVFSLSGPNMSAEEAALAEESQSPRVVSVQSSPKDSIGAALSTEEETDGEGKNEKVDENSEEDQKTCDKKDNGDSEIKESSENTINDKKGAEDVVNETFDTSPKEANISSKVVNDEKTETVEGDLDMFGKEATEESKKEDKKLKEEKMKGTEQNEEKGTKHKIKPKHKKDKKVFETDESLDRLFLWQSIPVFSKDHHFPGEIVTINEEGLFFLKSKDSKENREGKEGKESKDANYSTIQDDDSWLLYVTTDLKTGKSHPSVRMNTRRCLSSAINFEIDSLEVWGTN